jgi:hypothetical protein
VRWAVRADGLTFALRDSRKELYPPCTMTSNNAEWERGGSASATTALASPPPYTSKVLMVKTDSWHHNVSPPSRQQWLESLTDTQRSLADVGLGAASVLANLHHRWIIPLMERELRIFEMNDKADPTSLVRSHLLHERLPPEYAATRARRAISLKFVPHGHDDLWSFIMLPDAPAVSGSSFSPRSLAAHRCNLNGCH